VVENHAIGYASDARHRTILLLAVTLCPLTTLVGCSGCGVSDEPDGAYATLQNRFEEGEVIHVDRQQRSVALDADGEVLSDQAAVEWLREIGASPGVHEAVQENQPAQRSIVRLVQELDHALGHPEEAAGDLVRFYAGHLLSPDPLIRGIAFDELRKKRVRMNDFAPFVTDEDREAMREFVRVNPMFGTGDSGFGLQNAIANLGAAGRSRASIKLLESLGGHVPGFELSREAALARMGEERYEREIIDRYRKASAGREKASLASALGYISTEDTLSVLAADLRNDEIYKGAGFNQYVLSALTMGTEWTDKRTTYTRLGVYDEEDFDTAEAWCADRLETEWNQPRPPIRHLVPRAIE
jgi:hypothetical protein